MARKARFYRDGENKRPLHELQRPRRRLGEKIRELISCPLCWRGVKVVAWRKETARVECPACGFRFTLELDQIPPAIRKGCAVYGDDPDLATVMPGMFAFKTLDTDDASFVDSARKVYPGSPHEWTERASGRWPASRW